MLQVLHESHVPLDCAHFDPGDLQFRTIGTFEQVSSISQPGFLSRIKGLLSHLQYLGAHLVEPVCHYSHRKQRQLFLVQIFFVNLRLKLSPLLLFDAAKRKIMFNYKIVI